MDKPTVLTEEEMTGVLERLQGWRAEGGALTVIYQMAAARRAISFFAAIGELAEALNHHPDVDWRYNKLIIRITTHEADGQVTARDAELASSIVANASRFEAEAI